jgi:hypothetical protein
MRKVFLQALLGLVVSFAAFATLYFLRDTIPNASRHVYLSRIGELMVGGMIFACALGFALFMRFGRTALLWSAAIAIGIEISIMLMLGGWDLSWVLFSGGWLELLDDLWCIGRHTILPLALAGAALFGIRWVQEEQSNHAS